MAITELCLTINDLADVTNPSGDAPMLSDWIVGALFTGTYTSLGSNVIGGTHALELDGQNTGCLFEFGASQDNYIFYYVLISR